MAAASDAGPMRRLDATAFALSAGVAEGAGFASAGWPTSSE